VAKASSPCSNAQYRTLAESGALNEKLFPYRVIKETLSLKKRVHSLQFGLNV
jgi:hypothetical protein